MSFFQESSTVGDLDPEGSETLVLGYLNISNIYWVKHHNNIVVSCLILSIINYTPPSSFHVTVLPSFRTHIYNPLPPITPLSTPLCQIRPTLNLIFIPSFLLRPVKTRYIIFRCLSKTCPLIEISTQITYDWSLTIYCV